jgi:hypothetical protein
MGWVVNATSRPLYPPGNEPVPTVQGLGGPLDRCKANYNNSVTTKLNLVLLPQFLSKDYLSI